MKIAGGLLLAIGAILAVSEFLYQNDTGNKLHPEMVFLGIIVAVIGIVIFNVKPKKKD